MKTIAIIGGMGPQAGIHAHKSLVNKLLKNKVNANVVHISLNVEPFFNGSDKLVLSQKQKQLLKGIDADIGFIACNTAHHFFKEFQNATKFELVSIIDTAKIPTGSTIFCSPTTKKLELFGNDANYVSDTQTEAIVELIKRVNNGDELIKGELKSIIGKTKKPVFACTEISMCAENENVEGTDTLEQVIDEIIRRI